MWNYSKTMTNLDSGWSRQNRAWLTHIIRLQVVRLLFSRANANKCNQDAPQTLLKSSISWTPILRHIIYLHKILSFDQRKARRLYAKQEPTKEWNTMIIKPFLLMVSVIVNDTQHALCHLKPFSDDDKPRLWVEPTKPRVANAYSKTSNGALAVFWRQCK